MSSISYPLIKDISILFFMVYRRYFHDIDYKVGMNAIKWKCQVKKSDFSFLKDKRKFLGALAYKDKNDN